MTIQKIDQAEHLSLYVANEMQKMLSRNQGLIRIALSGGRSASYLIEGLLMLPAELLSRVQLYLVDERLEGELNLDTLLDSGLRIAFKTRVLKEKQLHLPKVDENISNEPFDAAYLSVGEDGHFASLFPGSYSKRGNGQTVLVEDSPKLPKRRVSLSYEAFDELAKNAHINLLFFGEGKRDALQRLLAETENPEILPCSFFIRAPFNTTIITDLEVQQ